MERQELMRQLKQAKNSLFITRKELASIMGRNDTHQIDWILAGLQRTEIGKLYYIGDIADRILERSTMK